MNENPTLGLSSSLVVRLLALMSVLWGSFAIAHGYGQRYDLPVPLWLYLLGSGAAVLLSFVAVGVFIRGAPTGFDYPRFNILKSPLGRLLVHPVVVKTIRVLSVAVFILIIAAGLFGTQSPVRNIAPALVWVIWWVGVAYVSALIGNIWALINPWKIIFEWFEVLNRLGLADPEAELAMHAEYPSWLGVWPGVLLFFAFAWVEIVSTSAALPVRTLKRSMPLPPGRASISSTRTTRNASARSSRHLRELITTPAKRFS